MLIKRPSDVFVLRHFTYKLPKLLAKCQTAVCKLCSKYNTAKSIKHVTDQSIALCASSSRIANKASNLILVPFWPVGRVVKAIHTAHSCTWLVLSQKLNVLTKFL